LFYFLLLGSFLQAVILNTQKQNLNFSEEKNMMREPCCPDAPSLLSENYSLVTASNNTIIISEITSPEVEAKVLLFFPLVVLFLFRFHS
jgi:hypothetical protein